MLIIQELLATFSGDDAAILRRAWLARPVEAASSWRRGRDDDFEKER
jgi:hypothetical protein